MEGDGPASSLQAAGWDMLLAAPEQVEIGILVVMEGAAFRARTLGIQKSKILGLLFC